MNKFNEFYSLFLIACEKSDKDVMHLLETKFPYFIKNKNISIKEKIKNEIRFFIEFKNFIIVKTCFNLGVLTCCENGNENVLKFLLNKKNKKISSDLDIFGDEPLGIACENNNLEIVKFLLFDNTNNIKFKKGKNDPLKRACRFGSVKVVNFFITNEYFKEKFEDDIFTMDYFYEAYDNEQIDLVMYLLNEEKTKDKIRKELNFKKNNR